MSLPERNKVKDQYPERSRSRLLVEVLFSLNIAFAATSIAFGVSRAASIPFVHLEVHLNHFLGITQTDYIRGYFTVWIPSVVLAVCLLSLLRLPNRLGRRKSFIQSSAVGLLILLCPTAIWTCGYELNGWSLQWPYKPIWGEAALVMICFFVFLKGPWKASRKIGLLALLVHCLFWYWFISDGFHSPDSLNWGMPGYAGPFGMVLGASALLCWGVYAYRASSELPHQSSSNQTADDSQLL